jgi:hypothetical protein
MSDGEAGEGEELKTDTVVKSPALNDLVLLRARFARELQNEMWAVEDYTGLYTEEQMKWIKEGLGLSLTIFDIAVERQGKQ